MKPLDKITLPVPALFKVTTGFPAVGVVPEPSFTKETLPAKVTFPFPVLSTALPISVFAVQVTFPLTVIAPVFWFEIIPYVKVIFPPTVTVLATPWLTRLLVVRVKLPAKLVLPCKTRTPPVVVRPLGVVTVLPAEILTVNLPLPKLTGSSPAAVTSAEPLYTTLTLVTVGGLSNVPDVRVIVEPPTELH